MDGWMVGLKTQRCDFGRVQEDGVLEGDVTGKRRAGSSMLPSATPGIGRVSGNRTSPEDGFSLPPT